MSLESAARSLLAHSYSEWLQASAARPSTPSWFSWWKDASASRFTSRLRALLLWSVRAGFLSAALLYSSLSILSDFEYGIGLLDGNIRHFQAASRLFPLMRTRRSGAAYDAILHEDWHDIPDIRWAVRHDPNAADLWYGLARMQLKAGDELGYNSSLTRLKELTPGLRYQVVRAR